MTKRKVRLLTIEDRFTREGLALDPDCSLTSRRPIRRFDAIAELRGWPRGCAWTTVPRTFRAQCCNGQFDHDVLLHFVNPGAPVQNAWIESFNTRVRVEFFNVQAFRSLYDTRGAAEAWLVDYNEVRAHSSLNYLTPKEFAEALTAQPIPQLPAA